MKPWSSNQFMENYAEVENRLARIEKNGKEDWKVIEDLRKAQMYS